MGIEVYKGILGYRILAYFLRDIGLLFFFFFFFFFFDMGYSGILGYGILEFILGYKLN